MSNRPDHGLNDQQLRFADEYLIDFNATAAYTRAGYTAKGKARDTSASRLLAKPELQAYLSTRKQALLKRTETDQDAALERLKVLALGDRRVLFNTEGGFKGIHELSAEEAAMIQGIEVTELASGAGKERKVIGYTKKVKLVNTLDAVRTLGQHYGLFAKKHEHTHKVEGLAGILQEIDGAETGPGPSQ